MPYKLGKQRPVFDRRTLRFASYIQPALPPAPPAVDYGRNVPTWPMYDNDKWGDCTCAAAGHMIQNWTANAGAPFTPPDQAVDAFYEHFVGNPPPADAGCNMLTVLKCWHHVGLDSHKVSGFTALELQNQAQAQEAIYLLGSIYIGVALPDFAVTGDLLTVPWELPPQGPVGDAAPNPKNGHCIPAVAYDATGLTVVTWGETKTMSWPFYNAYADEVYAVLSDDFIEANGETSSGFDTAQLQSDLKVIRDTPATSAKP